MRVKREGITRRWWFTVHKWLGLIVGLQVLASMVSGLYMTAMPIERVRSEHNIRKPQALDLRSTPDIVSPAQAIGDDFNNWVVIAFDGLGLVLTVGGIGILVYRFGPAVVRRPGGSSQEA